jgi:hypothetical protein
MDLKGAEIFSSGKWNSLDFSDADLDAIVASFNDLALEGRVPLKFGHNDEQAITDGQPSIGWVSRVWREGSKLIADFVNVPRVVAEAIRDRLYNFVSVELLQDAERSGSRYPWVLSAVALLGADPPAVSNLAELSRLVMSRRAALQFSRAGDLNLNGVANNMADDKMEAMLEKIAALEAKVATFSSENVTVKAERDKLIEDGRKEKATARKSAAELKFEAAITAKKLLPSARERFFKWTFPKDDEGIIAFDASEVDRYIEENKVTMTDERKTVGGKRDDEEGKTPDTIVAQRVRIFMSENEVTDYKTAMVEVLRDDPSLAEDYRHLPESRAK